MKLLVNLRYLILSVVIMLILPQPSQSHKCHKREQKDGGCSFHSYWSEHHWCEVHTYKESEFSFYMKPGSSFIELLINITRAHSPVGNVPEKRQELKVPRKLVPDTNKWYKIDLKNEKSDRDGKETHIFIDDYKKLSYDVSLTTDFKFILMANGSLYFRPTTPCNPAEFLVKEEGAAEPPPHSPLPPHPVTTAPPGHFGSTTNRPQLILGKSCLISVILGIAVLVLTAVSFTSVILIKKLKVKQKHLADHASQEPNPNVELNDVHIKQEPNDVHIYQEPNDVHIYQEPNDVHIYEEPNDVHINQEPNDVHIYEEPNDVHIYERPNDVHIYERPNDVHIYEEPNDVHIYEEPNDVHIYEEPNDVHIYQGPKCWSWRK